MTPSPGIPGTIYTEQPITMYPTSIDKLYTYQIFTLASAKAAGLPPSCYPKFNPALPVKNWVALDVDDTDVNEFVALKTVQAGDTSQIVVPGKMIPFLTQAGQASTLNLPDAADDFPAYVIAPTTAYEADGNNQLPINTIVLSTQAQADALVTALGGGPISEYQPAGGPSGYHIVYPDSETRRWYQFTDSFGQVQVVGILVALMNGQGVGRPGNWVNDGKSWTWLATPPAPVVPVSGPIFTIPMRHFRAGESVQDVGIGAPMLLGPAKPVQTSS